MKTKIAPTLKEAETAVAVENGARLVGIHPCFGVERAAAGIEMPGDGERARAEFDFVADIQAAESPREPHAQASDRMAAVRVAPLCSRVRGESLTSGGAM